MDAAMSFRDRLRRNREGEAVGITSVCSAHKLVLQAALARAARTGELLLVEATCNQVNQEGGYTGMTPAVFRARQHEAADAAGLPREHLLLGGDHLGPNPWRNRPASEAMQKAEALVAAFAGAGYRKLHLDASMACADDPVPLRPEMIARRAAALCAVAERSAAGAGLLPPLYVIGTEVPTPGGAHDATEHLAVTPPTEVAHTMELHRVAFAASGCADAFARAVAIVVQPGVEFGHDSVHDFEPGAAAALSAAVSAHDVVFEAHSTDYQRGAALQALVAGHFAILKVGPELTFALREAILALDTIAIEMGRPIGVRTALEAAMDRQHGWWRGYVAPEDRTGRLFSLSDRVRYYWPEPDVDSAVRRLMSMDTLPPALVSQYLPAQYAAWRDGALALTPAALLDYRVGEVLERYAQASN